MEYMTVTSYMDYMTQKAYVDAHSWGGARRSSCAAILSVWFDNQHLNVRHTTVLDARRCSRSAGSAGGPRARVAKPHGKALCCAGRNLPRYFSSIAVQQTRA